MQAIPGILCVLAALGQTVPTSSSAPSSHAAGQIQVYSVSQKVSDVPAGEDFSTPPAAYAAIARVLVEGDPSAWVRISAPELSRRMAEGLAKGKTHPRPLSPAAAKEHLEAEIVEVRVFQGREAVVLARLATSGRGKRSTLIDVRWMELHDGRWLNNGQDLFPSLEAARERTGRVWSTRMPPIRRLPVDDADAHLRPYVDFLRSHGRDPKAFVLEAVKTHPLVIIGELHHRPTYWAFNASCAGDEAFAQATGTIYMELPSSGQALVDNFLASETLDTGPVIEMLRDMLWMGWPDQAMLDFFVAVWQANQRLPASQRVRIVLVDCPRPWKDVKTRQDLRGLETVDRDRLMAEKVLADFRGPARGTRSAVFITGYGHAEVALEYRDGETPHRTAGWYLAEALGRKEIFAILQHGPVITNSGRVFGRRALGLFDSAFQANGNRAVAFPLAEGPFGVRVFDPNPELPTNDPYQDAFDGYLYLGPLEAEVFSPLIEGFYTDAFVQELDRRYRLMSGGKGLVESKIVARLDGKSFAAWMSESWGRPRDWTRRLGPITAWHYGDDWQAELRRAAHAKMAEDPEALKALALELFDAIRTADYDRPETVRKVDYMADHWIDVWARWVCQTFKANPIVSVALGNTSTDGHGRPCVDYVLTLKDGTTLTGQLPFVYDPLTDSWSGFCGLDWHLQGDTRRPSSESAPATMDAR